MSLKNLSENKGLFCREKGTVSSQRNLDQRRTLNGNKERNKRQSAGPFSQYRGTGLQPAAPPAILFCILFVITAVVGAICTQAGFALENPASHKIVTSQNFFTKAGIQWLLTTLVKNFTGFAPLGLVITMTLAIGFCEESGMLAALLRRCMKGVPPSLVPFIVAFLGVCGNIASDTAMVVIPPLAAVAYIGVRKHPVVGMMVALPGQKPASGPT